MVVFAIWRRALCIKGITRNFTFLVSFRSALVLCQRMKLVCNVAIVVGCSCLPFSANEVTSVHVLFCLFKSICSCSSSPCYTIMWLVSQHFVTADIMEMHFSLVMVSANDWAIRCCYGVLVSFFWITVFLKPLFFLCKGSVMLRQMESVLCGRFAVTNKIADNLPFSPHRQQKTSIIVDFHGAVLMCHIPAFELHVKIKFHFKK